MKEKVIELKHVSKVYKLANRSNEKVSKVLDDINLKIYRGDRVGLIGNNGVGKTTLLKIVAGITKPTSGEVTTKGKVVALMDLEGGFQLEMSGRENIVLNGLLDGMTRGEVAKKLDQIIDFSGIGDYIDQPFYTYSSGMKFRLAFSVAISSDCDILLMDEVFLMGDGNFQEKVFKRIKEIQLQRDGMAMILCSQVPEFVWGFSDVIYQVDGSKLKKLSLKESMKYIKERTERNWEMLSIDKNIFNHG